ncbi:3-hydroxyacyl-CoA dehydrogenase [Fodinisporobacter ferrooxydans]|uniref:3-hydroxyacyl-CoA dehydrogenase n=1 Tax=Fodinisporobacter ferrooxydans TaxID=2901836 RepID=A0ABY4CPN0_9BACL|nr:3-hydroxyacyl-CoA dehydrogenase [Alicyclobacillaceae bacterium MYW30-H2]
MDIRRIAVIGGGVMGRGIAYTAALSGYHVTLQDVSQDALEKAEQYIAAELNASVGKGYIQSDQRNVALENLAYTDDLQNAVKEADFVIEAVLELMELKTEIFKQLGLFAPHHAILATNTSTMSPTEIAASTTRPEKCVAMHFFNPVHKMKLVEIVRGLDTSDQTVEITRRVAAAMGKESVEIHEFPGFVTSRMNCLIGNEAMNMLMEGVASVADIDKALKLGLNHPMGPLELADLVGLDTRLRNMEYLYKQLGEKYRPSPILVKYVKAGRLGKKTGRGFYEYTK